MNETDHKYQNPDPRCSHHARVTDYCWAYAHHIEGTPDYEDMEQICRGKHFLSKESCEYWREAKKESGTPIPEEFQSEASVALSLLVYPDSDISVSFDQKTGSITFASFLDLENYCHKSMDLSERGPGTRKTK